MMYSHKALATAVGLLLLLPSSMAQYDRPLDFVYALDGGPDLPYNVTQLLGYIDQVQPPVTAVVPFLLNVANPLPKYQQMISAMQTRNITMVPGVGGSPTSGNINMTSNKDLAQGYVAFTDYIRLENLQGFYDMYKAPGIQDMIDYCVSIGFKHIMMNPWPMDGDQLVPFTNSEVDASINQVQLDKQDASVPTNWYPPRSTVINAIRNYRPTAQILVNYESAPQQDVLYNLGKTGSINAMNITLNQLAGPDKSENLHWIPPLDESYDAIKLGTWSWIAEQLSKM